jgi:hypothetical protein
LQQIKKKAKAEGKNCHAKTMWSFSKANKAEKHLKELIFLFFFAFFRLTTFSCFIFRQRGIHGTAELLSKHGASLGLHLQALQALRPS